MERRNVCTGGWQLSSVERLTYSIRFSIVTCRRFKCNYYSPCCVDDERRKFVLDVTELGFVPSENGEYSHTTGSQRSSQSDTYTSLVYLESVYYGMRNSGIKVLTRR